MDDKPPRSSRLDACNPLNLNGIEGQGAKI